MLFSLPVVALPVSLSALFAVVYHPLIANVKELMKEEATEKRARKAILGKQRSRAKHQQKLHMVKKYHL